MAKILKRVTVSDGKETVIIIEPAKGSNYMHLVSSDGDLSTTVNFRNVGNGNPDSAIQFDITKYNAKTNRSTVVSFSVPLEMTDLFLNHLQTVK